MVKRRNSSLVLILVLGILIALSACSGGQKKGANDPDYFYRQVELGMEKSQVESLLDVKAKKNDQTYIYIDDQTGFGVEISYDARDMVTSKMLYHKDDRKIMALSDASVSEDQISDIYQGMPYAEVKSLLGSDGVEIIEMAHPIDVNNPIVAMYWFNDDQTGFYITFLGHQGTVINVDFWK